MSGRRSQRIGEANERQRGTFVVAIDPGLDCTGWALFDGSAVPQRAGSWRTSPRHPLPERLARLTKNMDALDVPSGTTWVVETPNAKAVYARQRGRDRGAAIARGMAALHQAIGALVLRATLLGGNVELIPAPRVAKRTKQVQARSLLRSAGLRQGNADMRDAVWLGAYYLTRGPGR